LEYSLILDMPVNTSHMVRFEHGDGNENIQLFLTRHYNTFKNSDNCLLRSFTVLSTSTQLKLYVQMFFQHTADVSSLH
jgi:hypothetical protein